nr:MAG TPA: hypothetical protein [Caudoviricetes sp.]
MAGESVYGGDEVVYCICSLWQGRLVVTMSLQQPINRSKKKPPSIVLSSLVHPLR